MKKFLTTFLLTALLAGGVAAQTTQPLPLTPREMFLAPLPVRVDLSAADIQQVIDDTYAHQGGVVELPAGTHDLGTTPLRVYSMVTLAGRHLRNTDIIYHGTGPAIRLDEWGHKPSGGVNVVTFRDFRLHSDDQGIGYEDYEKALGCGDVTLERMELYTKGTAVALGVEAPPLGTQQQYSFRVRLIRVLTQGSPDYPGVDLRNAIQAKADGLTVHTDGTQPSRDAYGVLDGITTLWSNTIIEGPWSLGGMLVKRECKFDEVWFECGGSDKKKAGAVTIDGGRLIADTHVFFANPITPVILKNNARFFSNGEIGYGDPPKRANYATDAAWKAAITNQKKKSYLCSDTSQVWEHGVLVVGTK